MSKNFTATQLVAGLAAQTPLGWTVTTGMGYRDAYDSLWQPGQQGTPATGRWVRFERDLSGVKAVVVLNVEPFRAGDMWGRGRAFSGLSVEGHTLVNGGSFTRVGVDCSSCELVDDPAKGYGAHAYGDVEALLVGEWERCETSVARSKTAEPVAGTPFARQPEWFATAAADLKAGKAVSITPAGFGTGYRFSRRRNSRFDHRADAKLEARLGVAPLFYSTLDCD